MIELRNLNKTFHLKSGDVPAVQDVSLSIEDGEIYGIIGYSGAGKSTLVRCLNLLEVPDSGEMDIAGTKMVFKNGEVFGPDGRRFSEKDKCALRRGIGMIFQHFNLLDRSTVFDNIAYPLKFRGMTRAQIHDRVYELLKLVELHSVQIEWIKGHAGHKYNERCDRLAVSYYRILQESQK